MRIKQLAFLDGVPLGLVLIMLIFPFDQPQKLSNLIGMDLPIRLSQLLALGMLAQASLTVLKRLRFRRWSWIGILFALYVALNCVSLVYAPNRGFAMRQTVVLLTWPLIYLGVVLFLRHRSMVFPLLRMMLWVGYCNFAFSILQVVTFWTTGITLGLLPAETGDHLRGRAYAFYLEPNWFGVYQIIILPFLLWAFRHAEEVKIPRKVQQVGLGLFALSFLLGQNRGAIVALAVQFMVFVVMSGNLGRWVKGIAALKGKWLLRSLVASAFAVAVLGTSVNGMPEALKQQISVRLVDNLLSTEESAAGGRVIGYWVLWNNFLTSPLVGHGMASWATMAQGWKIMVDSEIQANSTAPNEYLRFLAEDGLIGLGLILGIIFEMFRRMLGARRRAPPAISSLIFAALISLVGMLVAANFYGVRGMVSALPMFGFYMALANLYAAEKKGSQRATRRLSRSLA